MSDFTNQGQCQIVQTKVNVRLYRLTFMSDSVNSGPSRTVQNKVRVHCANQSPCSALQTQINIRLQIEVDVRQYKQMSMSDFVNHGPYLIIQSEVN